DLLVRSPGVQDVARRLTGIATGQTVRPKADAVGADLQDCRFFAKAILAKEAHPTAELARSSRVRDEFHAGDLQRLLPLEHLDRLERRVGEDVGVSVEAVGAGPSAPGGAEEVDVNERLAPRVVAADRDAGVAPFRRGENP